MPKLEGNFSVKRNGSFSALAGGQSTMQSPTGPEIAYPVMQPIQQMSEPTKQFAQEGYITKREDSDPFNGFLLHQDIYSDLHAFASGVKHCCMGKFVEQLQQLEQRQMENLSSTRLLRSYFESLSKSTDAGKPVPDNMNALYRQEIDQIGKSTNMTVSLQECQVAIK